MDRSKVTCGSASLILVRWIRIGAAVSVACGALVAACGEDGDGDGAARPSNAGAGASDAAIDSTSPVDAADAKPSPDAGGLDADASGDAGSDADAVDLCAEGAMRCNGTGFDTCEDGGWTYRACAPGTSCRGDAGSIVCDF